MSCPVHVLPTLSHAKTNYLSHYHDITRIPSCTTLNAADVHTLKTLGLRQSSCHERFNLLNIVDLETNGRQQRSWPLREMSPRSLPYGLPASTCVAQCAVVAIDGSWRTPTPPLSWRAQQRENLLASHHITLLRTPLSFQFHQQSIDFIFHAAASASQLFVSYLSLRGGSGTCLPTPRGVRVSKQHCVSKQALRGHKHCVLHEPQPLLFTAVQPRRRRRLPGFRRCWRTPCRPDHLPPRWNRRRPRTPSQEPAATRGG